MRILVGTQNPGKLREFEDLLHGVAAEFVLPAAIGLDDFSPDETGSTFEENAAIKAQAFAARANLPTLADDSGLVVDALDGRPGVYSARYGGEGLDSRGRCDLLLRELSGVPDEQRTARFVAVIALVVPGQAPQFVRGTVEGRIAQAIDDNGEGFGYDPLFVPEGHDRSFGSLPKAIKHTISHRARAIQALLPVLQALTGS